MGRTRIASQRITNSENEFRIYGEPDDTGRQHITHVITHDVSQLPQPTILTLAALGFGRVAESRWNRKGSDDVPSILASLWTELLSGTWQPGRVYEEAGPTDLMLALAEVTNVPVHIVQRDFNERMKYVDEHGKYLDGHPSSDLHTLYYDARGRTHRFFDKARCDELSRHPKVAAVLARLARARGHGQRDVPALTAELFGQPEAQTPDEPPQAAQ